jgi:hypothetical protein
MIYLVQYDRSSAKLVKLQEFPASERVAAEEARLCIEVDLLSSKTTYEVVLLEASNKEELRKTHRRYFERLEQLLTAESSANGAPR